MNDPLRRTIRSLIQVVIAALLTALIALLQGWNASPTHAPSLADLKGGAIYLVFVVVTAAVVYVQNHLEDFTSWFPAVLKAPPSPGEHPVPRNATPPLPH